MEGDLQRLIEIKKQQKEWEDTTLKQSLEAFPEREILSELPKKRLSRLSP